MTYISTSKRRYARRARPQGMGDLFSAVDSLVSGILTGGGNTDAMRELREGVCAGDADASVADMEAQISDVDRTWNPTGFYTPDQIRTVILQTNDYATVAINQMISALQSTNIDSEGKEASKREFDSSYKDIFATLEKANAYLVAANQAEEKGLRAVDAPGLKLWVLQAMRDSKKLARAAAFIECNVSTFERFVRAVNNALDKLISVIKKIVGVVLEYGEKAAKVAFDFFGLLATLLKYAPYALIAGGGYYIYREVRSRY